MLKNLVYTKQLEEKGQEKDYKDWVEWKEEENERNQVNEHRANEFQRSEKIQT